MRPLRYVWAAIVMGHGTAAPPNHADALDTLRISRSSKARGAVEGTFILSKRNPSSDGRACGHRISVGHSFESSALRRYCTQCIKDMSQSSH